MLWNELCNVIYRILYQLLTIVLHEISSGKVESSVFGGITDVYFRLMHTYTQFDLHLHSTQSCKNIGVYKNTGVSGLICLHTKLTLFL